jgi:hypothetical protein
MIGIDSGVQTTKQSTVELLSSAIRLRVVRHREAHAGLQALHQGTHPAGNQPMFPCRRHHTRIIQTLMIYVLEVRVAVEAGSLILKDRRQTHKGQKQAQLEGLAKPETSEPCPRCPCCDLVPGMHAQIVHSRCMLPSPLTDETSLIPWP